MREQLHDKLIALKNDGLTNGIGKIWRGKGVDSRGLLLEDIAANNRFSDGLEVSSKDTQYLLYVKIS